jgi:hypothetical protein
VLHDEGFMPHPDKQRVMRRGARQEVTGVVVNAKPSVSREERRRLRAALHRAGKQGVEAATWQGHAATRDVLVGYARFVKMVDARQGQPLLQRALALPGSNASPAAGRPDAFRIQAAKGEAPARKLGAWWQPAPAPEPTLALTAMQIKTARQERLNTERAARNEAKRQEQAARGEAPAPRRPQPSAQAMETAAQITGAAPKPIAWWRYFVQLVIVIRLAMGLKSSLVFMLGMLWVGYAVMTRQLGWWRFAIAIIGIAILGAALHI